MIEIRELVIKAVVTKEANPGGANAESPGQGKKDSGSNQLDLLMEVLKCKNER